MKYVFGTILILAGIFIFSRMFLIQVDNSSVVSILIDITEKRANQPSKEEIIPLFDLDENIWKGVYFRYSSISDVGLTKRFRTDINYENILFSNEFARAEKVEKFKQEIALILDKGALDSVGKPYSSIYLPLVKELKVLSEFSFKSRLLIVYSDLMENGDSLSFYREDDFKRLVSDPESIQKLFNDLSPVPDLIGINVIFIYQPKDSLSDERYRAISGFYKRMLESRGAVVEIRANL